MSNIFTNQAKNTEAKVTDLLTAVGWTKRRMGQAANGCFSIAKYGNLQGEFIGLFADWELRYAVAEWKATEEPEAIAECILTQVAAISFPQVTYLSNSSGELREDVQPTEVLQQVPFEDGPGPLLTYLILLEGRYYALGNLEVMYASKRTEGLSYPVESVVTAACESAIEAMRLQSSAGVIVFPLDHEEMPDRCVISVAVPLREDSQNRVKARLIDAFLGFENLEKLFEAATVKS